MLSVVAVVPARVVVSLQLVVSFRRRFLPIPRASSTILSNHSLTEASGMDLPPSSKHTTRVVGHFHEPLRVIAFDACRIAKTFRLAVVHMRNVLIGPLAPTPSILPLGTESGQRERLRVFLFCKLKEVARVRPRCRATQREGRPRDSPRIVPPRISATSPRRGGACVPERFVPRGRSCPHDERRCHGAGSRNDPARMSEAVTQSTGFYASDDASSTLPIARRTPCYEVVRRLTRRGSPHAYEIQARLVP